MSASDPSWTTIRAACRRELPLDGKDASALEHAFNRHEYPAQADFDAECPDCKPLALDAIEAVRTDAATMIAALEVEVLRLRARREGRGREDAAGEVTEEEAMMIERLDWYSHKDDHWYDEIRIVGIGPPILRLVTHPRYKTSELSGDEWRTSVVWQTTLDLPGSEPSREAGWRDLDGPYGSIDTGVSAIYAGIYTSHRPIHDTPIVCVEFVRKGRVLHRESYEQELRPLLVTLGHLPWAWLKLGYSGAPVELDEWRYSKCFHPGCPEDAVSTYALKQKFCREGHGADASFPGFGEDGRPRRYARKFCPLHLRRGDGALEDADSNYTIVEGLGPDDARGWEAFESRSVRGPDIVLRSEETP